MSEVLMAFGRRVRLLRLSRRLSRNAFAGMLGKDVSFVENVEDGSVDVDLDMIQRIAEVLNIRKADLF
jgi:transcriptional regulator with XRE-family HTH domain